MENLQLEIGVNEDILLSDYRSYEDLILTRSWVQKLWQFMSDNNIKYDDETPKIQLAR